MRLRIILRYIGYVLLFNALFMLISAGLSFAEGDSALLPLLFTALITALIGVFPIIYVPATETIHNDEGLFIVVAGWLLASLIGALPYALWGGPFTFTNAWFESVSGFTTTGSSILNNIEAIPAGLLLWRSTTHFIGGIGIIVFMLAVVPSTGQTAMVLYRNEISSLAVENFRYRTQKTLHIILIVYFGLILLETLSLLILGMSFFDAITHSFATVATGGFSPRNTSVAFFDSPAIEIVIMVFMILSGIHFALIFLAVTVRVNRLWKSPIVRYYIGAILIGVLCVTIDLHGHVYASWLDALRFGAFQVISLGTSTGFATADSNIWPGFSKLVLIFFSLQCACAGSTSGGIKVDRMILSWKAFQANVKKIIHPKAVIAYRLNKTIIDSSVIEAGLVYVVIYLGVVFISSLALTFIGVDLMSAFSGSVAAMGNVGPGFSTVGSLANFSQIPDLGKWVLSIVMLLGRLEIFALLMFLFYKAVR